MSIDAFPPSIATTTTDDTLDALAGLSTSANTMPYFTGVDLAALTPLTPFMRTLLDDPDLATAQATLGIVGGGGGAPTDAEYIVGSAHGTLTQERVLTTTPTVAWDLATAGQAKANVPDASITEVKLGLSDVTTKNVSTTAHGLTPKLSGVATEYLSGTGLWTVPPAGTTYTDEQAQDAIGAMLLDTATIDLTYGDGGPTLQADVKDLSITEAKLTFVDVTTKDATTSVHGLLRKLSGTATQYLDGSGAWTTPAGGTNYWSRATEPSTLATAFTAWWKLEEASGDRVDSVGGLLLTPNGGANLTTVAGKIGNAVAMNGTAGTYLSIATAPAITMNTTTSFTVMCWVYLNAFGDYVFVSKGNAGANASYEYLLQLVGASTRFRFAIANGTTFQNLDASSVVPSTSTWYLLVGWYDQTANTVNLQINNGTVVSAAATTTSYGSAHAMQCGRYAGYAGGVILNGRLDMLGIAKRVLTTQERTDLWNAGAGLDHSFGTGTGAYLAPLTTTDSLLVGTARLTQERLEVAGAVKLGTTTGTTDGTLRWSGTDFEGRKAGAWVTMTAAAGQPLDATLTALAGLATGADQLPYATGTDTFAQTTLTTFARTLLDDTTQAAMRTTLALTPGTDVQAQDAELQALAGLVSAADRLPYFTGSGTAALATFTAAGRTLVGAADATAQRTTLGLGTLAQQDAGAVAITGGNIGGTVVLDTTGYGRVDRIGVGVSPSGLASGFTQLTGAVGIQRAPEATVGLRLNYNKITQFGIAVQQVGGDTGQATVVFLNLAGTLVGSIDATGSATAYNTTSDVRLKEDVHPLTGALDVVRALNPVSFLWKADGTPGRGFLAGEVQEVIPDGVITGEAGAVDEQGNIQPQMIDHSRLVVYLVSAVKELTQQVEMLQAQLAAVGG